MTDILNISHFLAIGVSNTYFAANIALTSATILSIFKTYAEL
jgi:hypothetical protein